MKGKILLQDVKTVTITAGSSAQQALQFAQEVGMFTKGMAIVRILSISTSPGTITPYILTGRSVTEDGDSTSTTSFWVQAGTAGGLAAVGVIRVDLAGFADFIRWRLDCATNNTTVTFDIVVYLWED